MAADYLDYRTLAIVLAAKSAFQAVGLGYVWHVHRKFLPARDWALGSAFAALGSLLLAAFPESDSAAMILGRTALIYCGMTIVASGLLRTCNARIPWHLCAPMLVAALAAHGWYTIIVPSFEARALVFSAFVSLAEIYVVSVVFNASPGPLRGTQRLIGLLLALQCSANILRCIAGLRPEFAPHAQSFQVYFLASTMAAAFMMSLLLAVLTSQHMNALLAATIDNLNQGVAMFDAEGKLIICNDRYGKLYGLGADRLAPGTALATIIERRIENGIFSGKNPADYFRERMAPVVHPTASLHQLSDGRSMAISRRPMPGGGWVTTHEDVTAFRSIESQLAYMAHHDTLTGLANRAVFLEKVEETFDDLRSRGTPFCVLLLDLDRFKAVNDSLGHPIGDALLKSVAERLRGSAREDDMIARPGGDEFAIIRTGGADESADIGELAERLLKTISEPFDLDGRKVAIGMSIGIARAPHDADSSDELLQKADLALYRAKSEGRNIYRFHTADMDAKAAARVAVEASLRKPDLGEDFVLRYRVMIDAKGGSISSAIAIPSWRGPGADLIGAAGLMEVAEQSGLAANLCAWTLRQTAKDARSWPDHVTVAVDLSPSQWADVGFSDMVAGALAASDLPAQRLCLRISGAGLGEGDAAHSGMWHELKARGVSFTRAEFGSGADALNELIAFPYDHVVIGEAFVAEIVRSTQCATIVAAMTGFAASLGIATVAEGVATAEQFEMLRAAGCTLFGGPLIGSPCRAADLAARDLQAEVA